MNSSPTFAPSVIGGLAFAVMAVFFVIPLLFMIVVSFYQPDPMGFYKEAFVWENYGKFFSSFYYTVSFRSITSSALGAVLVVALSFPLVLFVSDLSRRMQLFWIILLLSLMCLSEVIIGFAWLILMSESAGLPRLLEAVGLWDNPRSLSPSFGAMMIDVDRHGSGFAGRGLANTQAHAMRTLYLWIIATLLVAPFIVVLGVSIGASRTITFPPEALSGAWYAELLSEPDWLAAIGRSLLIAALAGLIATTVALAINYVLWRTGSRFAKATFALGLGPFLLPPIILALGASLFWAEVGWYGRIEATIISHGVFFVTLPLVIIARGFAALTDDVIEAAQMMGATPGQVFRTVVLPLIAPYVVTGFALVAIISVNEYLIANMISGFVVETLPIKIFNNVRYGYSPVVAAASMLFVVLTMTILLILARITDLVALFGTSKDS